jgi:hypothetical protein
MEQALAAAYVLSTTGEHASKQSRPGRESHWNLCMQARHRVQCKPHVELWLEHDTLMSLQLTLAGLLPWASSVIPNVIY